MWYFIGVVISYFVCGLADYFYFNRVDDKYPTPDDFYWFSFVSAFLVLIVLVVLLIIKLIIKIPNPRKLINKIPRPDKFIETIIKKFKQKPKKQILLILIILLTSIGAQAVKYKLTNLQVKPANCEWTQVLKPCAECDSIITAHLYLTKKLVVIDTPTKQTFRFKSFSIKNLDDYELISGNALDYADRRVWLGIFIYKNKTNYFNIRYADGEYRYQILN
jgi:hypothetical protein